MATFADTLYQLLRDVRTCIRTELAATADGAPDADKSALIPGQVAWDHYCSQLSLSVTRLGYSQTFPAEASVIANNCALPYVVATVEVTLLRCMPGMDDNGKVPHADVFDASMLRWLRDAQAVMSGVACCLNAARDTDHTILQYALLGTTPQGAEGGSIGVLHSFQVGQANTLCC